MIRTGLAILIGSGIAMSVSSAAIFERDGSIGSDRALQSDRLRWEVLDYQVPESRAYGGVAQVVFDDDEAQMGFGTGVLLDMRQDKSDPADLTPAYVLTAGHNILRPEGNRPPSELSSFIKVRFNTILGAPPEFLFPYSVKQIHFASIQSVDLALLELPVSLQSLLAKGIHGFEIADGPPAYSEEVMIVGAPEAFRRLVLDVGHSLESENISALLPQFSDRDWRSHVRTNVSMIEGMSGGPILRTKDRKIIGVAAIAASTINYFQPAWPLREAFMKSGEFDRVAWNDPVGLCKKILAVASP